MSRVNLNSAIWDEAKRREAVEGFLLRLAKRFKTKEVQLMEVETHTGVAYRRSSGPGFRRFHQASARGERPARDTGNLIDNIQDEKPAALVHDVFVNDSGAPYGKYLQDEGVLDRPIFKESDIEEFAQDELQEEKIRVANELTKGVISA